MLRGLQLLCRSYNVPLEHRCSFLAKGSQEDDQESSQPDSKETLGSTGEKCRSLQSYIPIHEPAFCYGLLSVAISSWGHDRSVCIRVANDLHRGSDDSVYVQHEIASYPTWMIS